MGAGGGDPASAAAAFCVLPSSACIGSDLLLSSRGESFDDDFSSGKRTLNSLVQIPVLETASKLNFVGIPKSWQRTIELPCSMVNSL